MLHLVTPDGRYHGDVVDIAEAKTIQVKAKYTDPRILSDAEWANVCANPASRSELCGTLGNPV